MANSTYATLAELKARLVIGDVNSDGPLQQILNSAANIFDQNTRKPPQGYEAYSESSSVTRYFDDYLRHDGIIEVADLLTVSALTRAGQTISSTNYSLHPYNQASKAAPYTTIQLIASALAFPYFYQISQAGGLSYNYPYPNVGLKQIAVTGTWGYCDSTNRPPEIKEATLRQAIAMWEWQGLSRAERVNMVSNPYKDLDPVVEQIACQYRREGDGWF